MHAVRDMKLFVDHAPVKKVWGVSRHDFNLFSALFELIVQLETLKGR